MDEDQQSVDTPPAKLSKAQKMGFFLLLIFAFLAVGLGWLQIRNTLYEPFALNDTVPTILRDEVDTIDALRFRDTDQEGLTDCDVLYIYNTSPYLADTDSDGLSDSEEIAGGTNPLCPEGKDCSGIAAVDDIVPRTTNTSSLPVFQGGTIEPGEEPPSLEEIVSDPAQVRQLLKTVGFTDEDLDQVSDAELMILVEQALSTSETQP